LKQQLHQHSAPQLQRQRLTAAPRRCSASWGR
jgi:hypothetical protein